MLESDADGLKEEGLALFKQGAYDEALTKFQAAATAYSARRDEIGQAEMLNNVGVIRRLQKKPEAAMTALKEAESILVRLDRRGQLGQVLGNFGDLYASAGNRDEAARCYSDAAALFAEVKDLERQSHVLRALSLLRLRQGRWLEAIAHMEKSLEVRPGISLPQRLFRMLLRFFNQLLAGQ